MSQTTNVNIVPSYGQKGYLRFSQYDIGRIATINLYALNESYTIPQDATVKLLATKPSGLGFSVDCAYSGNVVTVVSTETMTEESGVFPCELRILDGNNIIGTANFEFCVEKSPHPDGTIDGDSEEIINEISALVLEAEGYAVGTQNGVHVTSESPYYHNNAKYYSENVSLSEEFKQALLNCFYHVAWIDCDGQEYVDALETAMDKGVVLEHISAVYMQSGTVYDTDSLDSLRADLVVTAYYDDSSSQVVTGYTLSGTLEVGTSTITVIYGGKTTNFTVNVTEYIPSQGEIFGTFTSGISLSKVTISSYYPSLAPFVYKNINQTARACMSVPIENKGYIISVTDSTKYSVNVVDVTSLELLNIPNQNPSGNPDGTGYSCGNKTVGWNTTDSVSTPYLWIALKKNDGTNFTADELRNGAEAVFTYTES